MEQDAEFFQHIEPFSPLLPLPLLPPALPKMSSPISPHPMMRDNSTAVIFTVFDFLLTHSIPHFPRVETAMWEFVREHPTIGYLRNILGVVGHVFSHAELIEGLTTLDYRMKIKQQALKNAGRKLNWDPTAAPEASIFNLTGHWHLQLMCKASSTKWRHWKKKKPNAIGFLDMTGADKFETLSRVYQLLDWIAWTSDTHHCAEHALLRKKLNDAIALTDRDTRISIRSLRGLKRVVAELRESLLPLQFADGRPRRGKSLHGCENDCDGKKSGLRKAVLCDSCLSDMPLGVSPKTVSEVREKMVSRKKAEQEPLITREDALLTRLRVEAELKKEYYGHRSSSGNRSPANRSASRTEKSHSGIRKLV